MTGRNLSGRTAVVTGAAEGIGRAIAERLAAEGAQVVVADLQADKGRAVAEALGGRFVACDVSREADWQALAQAVPAPDILVNNAGVILENRPFGELSLATWRRVHAVNLDSVFLGCRWAVNAMAERGGAIVNMSSAGALRPPSAQPAYASSKAAIITLTKSVALYCGERGLAIRCNAVAPGSVDTPMTERLRDQTGDAAAARARAVARHPIGFLGAPQDIAAAVAYLASDDARFVTGSLMSVDGGISI